jgi:hypothetical protein
MNTFPTFASGALVPGLTTNIESNIRFVRFLDSRLVGETVILLARGVDRASVLPAEFAQLRMRYPRLYFYIFVMVKESWYGKRRRLWGWVHAQCFDWNCYTVFEVRRPMENCLGLQMI